MQPTLAAFPKWSLRSGSVCRAFCFLRESCLLKSLDSTVLSIVSPLGFDLVEIETSPKGRTLRIFIDRLDRALITVEDCAKVSHALQEVLDLQGVDYDRLEISSPGIDRALMRPDHFVRFVGEDVSVRLLKPVNERVQLEALLKSADEQGFVLLLTEHGLEFAIEYSNVKRATLKGKLNMQSVEKSQ
jgi:ribosome maturation factor RimP